MHKSLKTRLEALEQLEARAAADVIGPLTLDDCAMLRTQIILHNVTLDAAGQVVRAWRTGSADYTAQLDIALRRCNVALATLAEPPQSTAALETWLLRQVPRVPMSFDEALAQLDDLGERLAAGRATERAVLLGWCGAVDELAESLGAVQPQTADAYAPWLREYRRVLAFFASRTDAELDQLVVMDDLDPLLYTAEQRALADAWVQLVEQGDDDAQES